MSTYVMSDLHGRRDLFLKMLRRIDFKESDTLYILGDFADRGNEGLKIILDVIDSENIIPIMGNHDLTALYILTRLKRRLKPGEMEDMAGLISAWLADGGRETLDEFRALSELDQCIVLTAMDGFRNYAEVKVGCREFVLCHAGLGGFRPERPLDDYSTSELVFTRTDYSRPIFNGERYLVTGHTPTAAIEGAEEGRIYRANNHFAIDCGAVFGYGLGCLCLDTLEEFYVK